jgi:hypothetical protein
MAKRFTDTEKWKDEWFLELEPLMKILWLYILDSCDHAGVWKVNFKLASYSIGTALDRQSALKALGDRIVVVSLDKWHVPKFITYQQKGFLNPSNNAHRGIINLLEYHKIQTSPYLLNTNTQEPLETNSLESLAPQVKVKVKVKDSSSFSLNKEDEKNLSEILPQDFRNSKDSLVKADQLQNLFNETLVGKFGKISHCHGLSGDDLRELFTTLSFSNFQKIETWNEIFFKVSKSEFLNGSKGDFVATLNWLCKHKNALNVLNGQYSGTPNEQKGGKKSKTTATPDNPTGDPYFAELKEIRKNGEIA